MDWLIAVLAAVVGYLCGSISWARLIVRLRKPEADVTRIEVPMASGEIMVSNSVSATAVRLTLGPRFGILTAVLDMAKVAIPTLAFRLWVWGAIIRS